jgi:hypothetical protein
MIKCDSCGKTICSDRPLKCPFCGISFDKGKSNICPTCFAGFAGLECPHCGDEVHGYDDSSFYQDYIAKHYTE